MADGCQDPGPVSMGPQESQGISWLGETGEMALLEWGSVLGRMVGAAVMGAMVAGLYVYYRPKAERTRGFAPALILLAPLITMVIMAVGGNIAAAFTLVGTLAIVRFRTAVRDTRDTVYVIFAVAVGMAMGQLSIGVAVIGTAVIALVIVLMRWAQPDPAAALPTTTLRLVISPPDADPQVYQAVLEQYRAHARVLRSSIDKTRKKLSLRLRVKGLEAKQTPSALLALLAVPDIEQAAFVVDDE